MSNIATAEWQKIHQQSLVCNIHYDWSLEVAARRRRGDRSVLEEVYLPQLKEGGVDFDFMTVGGDHRHFCGLDNLADGSLVMLDFMLADIEESASFRLAKTSSDMLEAKAKGQHSIMLTIEGAEPIKEDLWRLRTLWRLGVRSVILTWFKANHVADGVNESRNGGLTQFGRQVIREMNRLGMIIDVAQCTSSTFDDVVALTDQPIIASHANASGQFPHCRNLTDIQLEKLASLGGVVGVHTFSSHLCAGSPTQETLLDHIDYIVKVVGDETVALGLNMTVAPDAAKEMFNTSNIDYTSLYVKGIESMNQFGNITQGLLQRGYSIDSIERILGLNFLRVVKDVVG